MHRDGRTRALRWLVRVALVAVLGGGCGGNGCSCLSPIPGGFPPAERTSNAAQVRLSSSGVAALTSDPAALVSSLVGGPLQFDVPADCNGTPAVCCPGGNPISPCGPIIIDLTMMPGDAPRLVVTPVQGASRIDVIMRARVRTQSDIPIDVLGLSCGIRIDTAPGADPDLRVDVPVSFSQDATAGTTRVTAGQVTITQLTSQDVAITGNLACQGLGLGLGFFIDTLTGTFEDAIQSAINDQLCKQCPSGQVSECGSFADACTDNVCMAGNQCLQELGATGRMFGAALFGGFSPGTTGALDLYEVAGGYATTNSGGVALGMLGGMLPAGAPRDRCGPPATAPAPVTITPSPYFQGNTRPDDGSGFDVAIGIHESQLDDFAYAAYDGGLLCLTVTTDSVDLLTSDTFSLFLPSLPNLTGGSRPMAIGLRPQSPPVIVLGRNTFVDDGNGGQVVDEPLLDITFTGLEIDFFTEVEDQYIRLFTLVSDLNLPLGIQVGAGGELTPVLGDVDNAFSNLSVKNSEPLTETPEELAATFPMILDLALPQLVGGLGSFQVPSIGGLAIEVTGLTAVDSNAYLAIFGNLAPAAMMAPAAPGTVDTSAAVVGQRVPGIDVLSDATRWSPAVRPAVELSLGGSEADLEWSTRIDSGLWSAWSRSSQRTVTSDRFWLQGAHTVEVRARRRGQPDTVDRSPAVVRFLVDAMAPVPELTASGDVIRIAGHDGVSGDRLTVRWRLGGGAWHEEAAPVEVALGSHAAADLDVEVIDEVGNVAPTRGSQAVARADFHGAPGQSGCGCSSSDPRGTGALALLVVGFLWLRRRTRRWLRAVAVLVTGATLPACDCGSAPCGDQDCLPGEISPGPLGRWNSAASDGSRTVIATYDTGLGDLVVADVGAGGELSLTAVDGVPDETPTYDPGTYRGGIETPGPDVGAWTSIALEGGLVRVAYQDRERGALRFASQGDRGYASHDVDAPVDPSIELGRYASMVYAGSPAIAYMATGVPTPAGGRASQLRLARASSANPNNPGAWTTAVLAQADSSCAGLCGSQKCVEAATQPGPEVCVTPTADCSGACGNGEVCVTGACRTEVPFRVIDLPGGTGLFANLLVMPDGRLAVVHHDRTRSALVVLVESAPGSSTFNETVLDGDGDPDRGLWASAAVDASGTIHVAYQDALGDQVFYATFNGTPGTPELVDDGVRTGDRTHNVGAGATLWLEGGSPRIAYQDGTSSDLVLATRGGSGWTHQDLVTGPLLDGFHIAVPAGGGLLVWDQLDKLRSPPHGLALRTMP